MSDISLNLFMYIDVLYLKSYSYKHSHPFGSPFGRNCLVITFYGILAWWNHWKSSWDSHVLRNQKGIFFFVLYIPLCRIYNPILITQFLSKMKTLWSKHSQVYSWKLWDIVHTINYRMTKWIDIEKIFLLYILLWIWFRI